MAGAVGADVGAARGAVDLRGDRLQDRRDRPLVWLPVAAGHDARPVQRALLAAGDADAEEVHAVRCRRPRGGAECPGSSRCRRRSGRRPRRGGGGSRRSPRRSPRPPEPCSSARAGARARRPSSSTESDPISGPSEPCSSMNLSSPAGRAVVHGHRDVVMGEIACEVRAHRRQAGEAHVSFSGHATGIYSDGRPVFAHHRGTGSMELSFAACSWGWWDSAGWAPTWSGG